MTKTKTARPVKTKNSGRLKLAAANARAALAQSSFRVVQCDGLWFVEAEWDVGYSCSGNRYYAREPAELELEYLNCRDHKKMVEYLVKMYSKA